jgi:hypothetical protein
MKSIFYGTVLVCLLAGLLAFATTLAVAQTSNQSIQDTAATIQDEGSSANSDHVGFSGEAKAGMSQSPMANSLIDCQRAMLGRFCAEPEWAIGKGKDRLSPGHDELN